MILPADNFRAVRFVKPGLAALAALLLLAGAPKTAQAMTCSSFTVYRTVTVFGVVVWEGVYEQGYICN